MKLTPTFVEPRAATVDLAYPELEPAHLRLDVPFGKIVLEPGAGESLASGKVTYNIEELKPKYSQKDRSVRIRQQYRVLIPTGRMTNDWEFLLGSAKPYSLELNAGASSAELDLGGLPLNALKIESGAGDLTIDFSSPNLSSMSQMKIGAGAGRTTIRGLVNANFEKAKISAGAGQTIVDLTGAALTSGGFLKVESGVGEIVLNIAAGLPVRVETELGLGGVDSDEDLYEVRGGYQTANYDDADIRLDVIVKTGVGAIKLNMV